MRLCPLRVDSCRTLNGADRPNPDIRRKSKMPSYYQKFAILLFTCICTTSWASSEPGCNPAGTQAEMNACANDEFAKADKELNDTYQLLIQKTSGNPLATKNLRSAQRAWIAFRDADLESHFPCSDEDIRQCWGSISPQLRASYKAELTRERTRRLQHMLKHGLGE